MLLRRIGLHWLIAWPIIVSLSYATRSLPGFRAFFELLEPGYFLVSSAAVVIALNAAPLFLVPLAIITALAMYPTDGPTVLQYAAALLLGVVLGGLGRLLTFAASTRRTTSPQTLRPTTWTPPRQVRPQTPPVAQPIRQTPIPLQRPRPAAPPPMQRPRSAP